MQGSDTPGEPTIADRRPRLLFLFSDTGGGHRSACEAILEAMRLEFGGAVETTMIDFLRDYFPWPYRRIPEFYAEAVRFPRIYGRFFHVTNTPRRTRLIMDLNRFNPWLRHAYARMLAEHPAELLVTDHYMSLPMLAWTRPERRPRTAVVVTDLVTTHAVWFRNCADRYIVPTEAARDNAVRAGIDRGRIEVIGLPVAERFSRRAERKAVLRERLGWGAGRPVVLLVGGGEGMGPLKENASAIAHAGIDLELAVVAGRNRALGRDLAAQRWPAPVHVYGFTHEMHNLMGAADVLVTKAGPSSICEGLNAGLPIILYDHLPGQEEGNVAYLLANDAGAYAPTPARVVATLRAWLDNPAELARMAANARSLARPDAARQIARRLAALAEEAVALTRPRQETEAA